MTNDRWGRCDWQSLHPAHSIRKGNLHAKVKNKTKKCLTWLGIPSTTTTKIWAQTRCRCRCRSLLAARSHRCHHHPVHNHDHDQGPWSPLARSTPPATARRRSSGRASQSAAVLLIQLDQLGRSTPCTPSYPLLSCPVSSCLFSTQCLIWVPFLAVAADQVTD